MSLPNIYELNALHKSDKASHSFHGINFIDIYDKYLGQNRKQVQRVLEIGVRSGQSMKLWHDYFPNAQIVGIDIAPQYEGHGRIQIHKGDQGDLQFLQSVILQSKGEFDIVIDDGSHINELTIKSFNYLWTNLKSRGFYFIEDLKCSYINDLETEMIKGGWQGLEENRQNQIQLTNNRADMNSFFFEKIRKMDFLEGEVSHIDFWPMMAILQKC